MKCSRRICCAAAGAAAGQAPKEGPPKTQENKPTKKSVAVSPFNVFKFKPWQLLCLNDDQKSRLLPSILLHGDTIGPRPLILLDCSFNAEEAASPDRLKKAAALYEPIVSHLAWEQGVVYIPLTIPADGEGVLFHSTQQVNAVLDALDVRWSNVLAHSYGGLTAARMMAQEFPHRIGSCILLDTPLVTQKMVDNAPIREEIAAAEEDVNVPLTELEFAKHNLLESLEETLPCPAESDRELYEKNLFDPKYIFAQDGIVRRDDRYLSASQIKDIFHPLQLVVPAKGAVADATVHKDFLRIRRPAVVKGATSHAGLFDQASSGEVADVIRGWINRFEPDVMVKRRYEQAAKEMSQLMGSNSGSAAAGGGAASSGDSKKKKKEKKKK